MELLELKQWIIKKQTVFTFVIKIARYMLKNLISVNNTTSNLHMATNLLIILLFVMHFNIYKNTNEMRSHRQTDANFGPNLILVLAVKATFSIYTWWHWP